jgi:hypothetical protein
MTLPHATVATLRERLATLPDDAAVVLFDHRTDAVTRVLQHVTVEERRQVVVLHLEGTANG